MTGNQQEREQLLTCYADLRVADVRDGMDWCGMHHYGSMSPDIRYGTTRKRALIPG